ncbi:class I SAM-dependent methyltransferase [Hanamia caeni]|uniref:Class I SAM-dependent methyltransferase n=1 Tax=Hanamia caeni TaxID=2294116 RepID=A0A3M9NM18_9BACT|nr:methyltransferase domain-containing protein [Hanamia caeni]RNI38836.1 class I SAM-dependent methyltransferase [Hanamia caeni]
MKLKAFASSFNNKMIFLKKSFDTEPFRLLDIGAGNHSATKIKNVFPRCEYSGVDMEKDYNNSEEDFSLMKSFYELDLTQLEFSSIPENYFDGIWMVHVIEHLWNGDEVIKALLPKLKKGGYLYIEYPGVKSKSLPSMKGSLNFHDDPTHVRLYSVKELASLFDSQNCKVLKMGTRRNPWYMMAMPFRFISSSLKGEELNGNIFWDILGFAEYLWVKKK